MEISDGRAWEEADALQRGGLTSGARVIRMLVDDRKALQERVKEAEVVIENRYDKHTEIIARLEARLRAAEEVVEAANKVFRTAERNERLANRAALDELRNALRHYNEAVGK